MFKPAQTDKDIISPHLWDELPNGLQLKRVIEKQLQPVTEQCFGYHLIKLGHLSHLLELNSCQISHKVAQTSSDTTQSTSHVLAKSTALPYAEKSVDAFVLGLELDFSADPHQILREMDRCLVPNGHVIIIGFNPYSMAGIARWIPVKKAQVLRQARFFSRGRVKDWLSLLGYQVTVEQSFLFSDLILDRNLSLDSKIQRLTQKYFAYFASLYVIVGKKREFPLSLIKSVWKPAPKFSPVGASMRISGNDTIKSATESMR